MATTEASTEAFQPSNLDCSYIITCRARPLYWEVTCKVGTAPQEPTVPIRAALGLYESGGWLQSPLMGASSTGEFDQGMSCTSLLTIAQDQRH